jgi:hypothetical protein
MYVDGVFKALVDFEKIAGFFSPTAGALAARIATGAALGSGAGYLAGKDLQSMLTGATLGSVALGAGPLAAERIGLRMLKPGVAFAEQPALARYGLIRGARRAGALLSKISPEISNLVGTPEGRKAMEAVMPEAIQEMWDLARRINLGELYNLATGKTKWYEINPFKWLAGR